MRFFHPLASATGPWFLSPSIPLTGGQEPTPGASISKSEQVSCRSVPAFPSPLLPPFELGIALPPTHPQEIESFKNPPTALGDSHHWSIPPSRSFLFPFFQWIGDRLRKQRNFALPGNRRRCPSISRAPYQILPSTFLVKYTSPPPS